MTVVARDYDYRDGSGVHRVLQRLEEKARHDKKHATIEIFHDTSIIWPNKCQMITNPSRSLKRMVQLQLPSDSVATAYVSNAVQSIE